MTASVQKTNQNTQEVRRWTLFIWRRQNRAHFRHVICLRLSHKLTVNLTVTPLCFLPCEDQIFSGILSFPNSSSTRQKAHQLHCNKFTEFDRFPVIQLSVCLLRIYWNLRTFVFQIERVHFFFYLVCFDLLIIDTFLSGRITFDGPVSPFVTRVFQCTCLKGLWIYIYIIMCINFVESLLILTEN